MNKARVVKFVSVCVVFRWHGSKKEAPSNQDEAAAVTLTNNGL